MMFAVAASFLVSGCAQNAIFELTLDVPPPVGERSRVVIEARTGDADFSTDWQQTQITGIPLTPAVRNSITASFEASGDDIVGQLKVKVRFCVDERCLDTADGPMSAPEQRYEFDRVFYQGRYTTYAVTLDELPDPSMAPPVEPVDKCSIAGDDCWEGAPVTNNCLDGTHFCE
jgi:hypothetical protein